MSLQPPEYWLKMHNIELQQLMAQAERTRQRSQYQGNGTALRSPGRRARTVPPASVVPAKPVVPSQPGTAAATAAPAQPGIPAKPSDNRALGWFRSLMARLGWGTQSTSAAAAASSPGRQPADCCA